MSPALAGGFLTTVPPGKSRYRCINTSRKWTVDDAGAAVNDDEMETEIYFPVEFKSKFHYVEETRWPVDSHVTDPTRWSEPRWQQQ